MSGGALRLSKTDLTLTERVRALRLDKGITQGELAKALGISAQRINQLERARARFTAAQVHLISRPS